MTYKPGQLRGKKGGLFERLGRAPNKALAQQLRPPDPIGPMLIYRSWVRAFWKLWSHTVLSALDVLNTDSASFRADALPPDFRTLWDNLFRGSGFGPTVTRTGKAVTKQVENYMGSIFKVPPVPPDQTILIAHWRQENLRLINNVSDEQVLKLTALFSDAQATGAQHKTLVAGVREVLGAGESRAKLIARDQTTKFNSSIQEVQQNSAGIAEFIWSTSHDGAVRPSHAVLDGKTFAWNNPPIVDGQPAKPGTPINCRCQAVPKIPLFAGI